MWIRLWFSMMRAWTYSFFRYGSLELRFLPDRGRRSSTLSHASHTSRCCGVLPLLRGQKQTTYCLPWCFWPNKSLQVCTAVLTSIIFQKLKTEGKCCTLSNSPDIPGSAAPLLRPSPETARCSEFHRWKNGTPEQISSNATWKNSKYYSKNEWLLVKQKNCCRLLIKRTLCDGGTWQSVAPWLCQTWCCLRAPRFFLDACAAPELQWLLPRLQRAAHIEESCGRVKAQGFHGFQLAATTGESYAVTYLKHSWSYRLKIKCSLKCDAITSLLRSLRDPQWTNLLLELQAGCRCQIKAARWFFCRSCLDQYSPGTKSVDRRENLQKSLDNPH